MPDSPADDELSALYDAARRWRTALATIRDEAPSVGEVLDEALRRAGSTAPYDRARATLRDVAADGSAALGAVRELVDRVEALRGDWTAAHRYTDEAVHVLVEELRAGLAAGVEAGARRWLYEILDAADDGAENAAARIATADLPWPAELSAGAERVGAALGRWRDRGRAPDLEPIEELADRRLPGWEEVLTPELRSRAHRFAAWVALRTAGDQELAGRHIDEAVNLYGFSGRMHAENAAFHLFAGDFDRAVADAHHAIEIARHEPFGHLALGMWAELTGKFSGADDLYRRGLDRMHTADIRRISQRTSLVDPPGRLLKAAAAKLLEAGDAQAALERADDALAGGMRGPEAHPEAEVHVIRRRALERLHAPAEAAAAAMEGARMCIWNGDIDCAIEELERAIELNTTHDAGWLLADAMLAKSFPLGAAEPDQEMVERAWSTWDSWSAELGEPPRGSTSWAYLTRAIIADLQSQRPDADRRAGIFQAILFVEKALSHDDTDAQRWGYAAQFLRYAGLEELAFEAVERGYALAATDRQVLAERLPLLANRREFDTAAQIAEQLVTMYGADPWVSAVRAWLALHHGRRYGEALELLELPLREGNDQAWYREMQALAHLGRGDVERAHDSYRRLLEAPPIDGNTKCRLALAALALGDHERARAWLDDAREDSTTPRSSYLMARAIEALAEDAPDDAARRLDEAVRLCSSAVAVDDVLYETMLGMRALARGEDWVADRERMLGETIAETVASHLAALSKDPPTADAELERALADVPPRGPLTDAQTALLAVAARRHRAAGRHDEAARIYERLRGSRFEPEAVMGLERAARLAGAGA
jgi:tetratricopeptide (TPR) repeat protein